MITKAGTTRNLNKEEAHWAETKCLENPELWTQSLHCTEILALKTPMKRKGLTHHLSDSTATYELSLIINLHVRKSSTSCNTLYITSNLDILTLSLLHMFSSKGLKKEVERTHYKYSWAWLKTEICEILNRALHTVSNDSWSLCICIQIQTS